MSKKKNNNKTLLVIGGLTLAGIALGLREAVVTVGERSTNNDDDMQDVIDGLRDVQNNYGRAYAENIERLLRWETAHFKSGQWRRGNTAGMEATRAGFPFGWSSLLEWATIANVPRSSFSTFEMRENGTNKIKTFIRFANRRDFINFLAWFIQNKRGGNFGYWYSLDNAAAARYAQSLRGVVPRIVNTL